jgi:hypothetical protein
MAISTRRSRRTVTRARHWQGNHTAREAKSLHTEMATGGRWRACIDTCVLMVASASAGDLIRERCWATTATGTSAPGIPMPRTVSSDSRSAAIASCRRRCSGVPNEHAQHDEHSRPAALASSWPRVPSRPSALLCGPARPLRGPSPHPRVACPRLRPWRCLRSAWRAGSGRAGVCVSARARPERTSEGGATPG